MYLITPLQAQSAPAASSGFDPMQLLPLLLIGVVFYFFLIRPQQKKVQQTKAMLSTLRRGDRVITNGGIFGVITKVLNEQELQVEIAEGVRVRVARSMVADVLSKTEPVSDTEEDSSSDNEKKSAPKLGQKKAANRSKKSA